LCGKIRIINNEKIKYQKPQWVYFSPSQNIEITHFYHIWPGIKTDIIYIGEKPNFRFYFANFNRILFNDFLLDAKNPEEKAIFLGGFEPLIDIIHFKTKKIDCINQYRLKLTETFGLIELKTILRSPISFDGVLYNIVLDKDFPYINLLFKIDDHIKGIENILELGLHVEIALLFVKDDRSIDKNILHLAKKLSEINLDIPIHLVRLTPITKEVRHSISTGRLTQIWKRFKYLGFRYVYIDGLFLFNKNFTSCHCLGVEKKLLDHHGPWDCLLSPSDSPCLKECNIIGKPTETVPFLEKKKICN